jgi:hypothetical protein
MVKHERIRVVCTNGHTHKLKRPRVAALMSFDELREAEMGGAPEIPEHLCPTCCLQAQQVAA